ncbi:pterocarpan synthase [Trifolium repens]|nr:pterocarpan synthase [Trifolium repens]
MIQCKWTTFGECDTHWLSIYNSSHNRDICIKNKKMENKSILIVLALFLCSITIPVHSEYHSERSIHSLHLKEKVTQLHFYLFDILSGNKPSAVQIAQPNTTIGSKSAVPFGHLYAFDDPLREGPNKSSKVIGNAQGLYLSSSQQSENFTIVLYADFAFTKGKFKGSSISVFSRNPVTEPVRELAVVGGRGKFRLAKGFIHVRTHSIDYKTGDAILDYHVTVLHYH